MSLLLKCTIFSRLLFRKYLGRIVEPIKKAINAIISVTVRLGDSIFNDSNRKMANKKITIKGLNMWLLKILFRFRKLRKFSPGYNPLK